MLQAVTIWQGKSFGYYLLDKLVISYLVYSYLHHADGIMTG